MGGGTNEALTSWVSTNCAVVPSTAYASSTGSSASERGGGTQLYDCGSKPAARRGTAASSTTSATPAQRIQALQSPRIGIKPSAVIAG